MRDQLPQQTSKQSAIDIRKDEIINAVLSIFKDFRTAPEGKLGMNVIQQGMQKRRFFNSEEWISILGGAIEDGFFEFNQPSGGIPHGYLTLTAKGYGRLELIR